MIIQSSKIPTINFKNNNSKSPNNIKNMAQNTCEPAPIDKMLFDEERMLNSTNKQKLLDVLYLTTISVGIGILAAIILKK